MNIRTRTKVELILVIIVINIIIFYSGGDFHDKFSVFRGLKSVFAVWVLIAFIGTLNLAIKTLIHSIKCNAKKYKIISSILVLGVIYAIIILIGKTPYIKGIFVSVSYNPSITAMTCGVAIVVLYLLAKRFSRPYKRLPLPILSFFISCAYAIAVCGISAVTLWKI